MCMSIVYLPDLQPLFLPLNQWVQGSSPWEDTKIVFCYNKTIAYCRRLFYFLYCLSIAATAYDSFPLRL